MNPTHPEPPLSDSPSTGTGPMSCFDWQNRSADYLDGTMIASLKRDADQHLDACPACNEKHGHYRRILTSISGRPRVGLPIAIRKNPLSFILPRLESGSARSTRWERTPWFIRTSVEGLGVAFLVLGVIAMVPRIRGIYDRSLERRLDVFSLSDLTGSEAVSKSGDSPPVPTRGKTLTVPPGQTGSDEFNGESADTEVDEEDSAGDSTTEESGNEIRVGSSEIWRFNLKTDSPHEIQPRIVALLTSLNIPKETPGIGGIEAPGGIQFDLIVPTSVVANLKIQLRKLAPSVQGGETENPTAPNAAFTWYKNKSKRQIPAGRARVVIWLSQM